MKKLLALVLIPSICLSAEFSPVKDDAIHLDVLGGLGGRSYSYALFKDGTYFFQLEHPFLSDTEAASADGIYSGKLDTTVLPAALAHIAESNPGDEDILYDCDNFATDATFIKLYVQQNSKGRTIAYYTGCESYSEHSESVRKLREILEIQSYLDKN